MVDRLFPVCGIDRFDRLGELLSIAGGQGGRPEDLVVVLPSLLIYTPLRQRYRQIGSLPGGRHDPQPAGKQSSGGNRRLARHWRGDRAAAGDRWGTGRGELPSGRGGGGAGRQGDRGGGWTGFPRAGGYG